MPNTAQDLRATGAFSVEVGLAVTTAETTTLPYRLAPQDAIKIPAGASWRYPITWYAGAAPVNLATGYTASFTVRAGAEGAVLMALTEADGITLGGGEANVLLVRSASATAALAFVRGWAQLTVVDASARARRLLEGYCDLVR